MPNVSCGFSSAGVPSFPVTGNRIQEPAAFVNGFRLKLPGEKVTPEYDKPTYWRKISYCQSLTGIPHLPIIYNTSN